MKIVLLTLSGDQARARDKLQARFPDASFATVTREELEQSSSAQRISLVRSRHPDLFAVGTERLAWQRRQDAFLLLGALAGARGTIILDAHGGWRKESRSEILFRVPARLAQEFATGKGALRRAERELRQFEAAIIRGEHRREVTARTGNPLNIVYLRSSPGPGTQAGGAATHINGFLDAALELGARVSLISNDEIAALDAQKLPVKINWPKPIGSTRAAFDIYNNLHFTESAVLEIQNEPPDFVYQRYARFSWAGVAAALRTKRPLFLEYNGSEVWVGRHWDRVDKLDLLARYERLNLNAAARIFVVSEVERQNLLQAGIEPERIIVNPNGVDVDKFKPGIGRDEARRELGLTPGEIVVGFIGTFGSWHGAPVLARAFVDVAASVSNARLLLVGEGPELTQTLGLLSDAGLADRIMSTGAVSPSEVADYLDACDVLASPHVPLAGGVEFFGSPTKLFEYMAAGKAIVASRLGQIGETLEDGETALLVTPGDAEELAAAVKRLATAPELRSKLGANARRRAIEQHSWDDNVQQLLDAYPRLRTEATA